MTATNATVMPVTMHLLSTGNSHKLVPARQMPCWELTSCDVANPGADDVDRQELVQVTVEVLPGRTCYFWMIRADAEMLGIVSAEDKSQKLGRVLVWFTFDPNNHCMPTGAVGNNNAFIPYCEYREDANRRWTEWRRGIAR